MRHEDIEHAVAVHITQGDPHIGLRLARPVIGDAAHHRLVDKGAVLLIDP